MRAGAFGELNVVLASRTYAVSERSFKSPARRGQIGTGCYLYHRPLGMAASSGGPSDGALWRSLLIERHVFSRLFLLPSR